MFVTEGFFKVHKHLHIRHQVALRCLATKVFRQITSHEKGGAVSAWDRPVVRTATEYKIVVTGFMRAPPQLPRIEL